MESVTPLRMHIFDGSASPAVDAAVLAEYCRELLGKTDVLCHGDFVEYGILEIEQPDVGRVKNELVEALSGARVTNVAARAEGGKPQKLFVDYERRMLERRPPRPVGVLYDGFELCLAYGSLLTDSRIEDDDLVVVITNQLFGTLEEGDSRYHARVIVFGSPCIISTTGLVEAPARPRSYYVRRQLGLNRLTMEKEASEDWLRPDDPRTTEVMKGYMAQAIFYHLTGEPFCEERSCRLFNAHWQEDMLFSQLGGQREFCERHEQILRALSGATNE